MKFNDGERVEYSGRTIARMSQALRDDKIEGSVVATHESGEIEVDWDWNPVGDPYPYMIDPKELRSIEDRTKHCVYCNRKFTPPKEGTKHCIHCHYDGTYMQKEKGFDKIIDAIKEEDDLDAEIWHGGGGCFTLIVCKAGDVQEWGEQDWDDESQEYKRFVPFACATLAYRPIDAWGPDSENGDEHGFLNGDERDYEWTMDAGLPEKPDDPWGIMWYETMEQWQGDWKGKDPESLCPAYVNDIIKFVKEKIKDA